MIHNKKPKVGLLALTLELYETLAPALRKSREAWLRGKVIPALQTLADISFEKAVFNTEQIDCQIQRFQAQDVDAMLVVCLTYSPSLLSAMPLKRTTLPIMFWNTQELYGVNEHFTGAEMLDNHGVHGTHDLCNVLTRSSVKFHYITSHLNDTEGLTELKDFFVAAKVVRDLKTLKVGLMGYPFPGMGDFAIDPVHAASTLGFQVVPVSVQEYIDASSAAAPIEVEGLRIRYQKEFDLTDTFGSDDLDATIRAELALRGLCEKYGFNALSYQFLAFGQDDRSPTLPFVAASRLMADGYGFAGEGDVLGAAGTWLLNALEPPATFSEIFTIDFEGNSLFMSHMGEANVRMAAGKVKLVGRSTPITRTRFKQIAPVMTLCPGLATFYALTLGAGGQWKIIASLIEIAGYKTSAPMETPYFKVCPRSDVRDFLTAYAYAGGPHHNAVCFGDARNKLRIAAELMGAAYIEL